MTFSIAFVMLIIIAVSGKGMIKREYACKAMKSLRFAISFPTLDFPKKT